MSRLLARFLSSSTRSFGVWSDFSSRPSSLKVLDKTARNELFEGVPGGGPTSLEIKEYRAGYHSPELVDDTFKLAYEILEEDAAEKYHQIEKNKASLSGKALDDALIDAEKFNPEVLYNMERFADKLDRSVPIYRKFLKDKWESYDQMLTMQRIEQLGVIPDTLPTLVPEANVRIKFSHNTEKEFSDWVVPGTRMPAFAVSKPPTIEIQEFELVEGSTGLYSVIVVNPDVPDLDKNSFKVSLLYGLKNVPLDFVNNTITPFSLLENPERVFKVYAPVFPEKNAPTSRACLWVFRQAEELKDVDVSGDTFDIRSFVENHNLHAIGAHVWRQDYDRSTSRIRAEYGLEKGRVFNPVRNATPLM